MARIRRLAVLVGAVALTGAFVAGPATADAPEVFSGSAAGTALDLAVLGKQATFGASTARVNSAGVATGTGAGHFIVTGVDEIDDALGTTSSKQVADAPTGETVTKGRKCQSPDLPAEVTSIVTVGTVCSAAAAGNANQPYATSEGSVAEADVHVESLITKIEDEADTELPIGSTLAGVLEEVCGAAAGTDAESTVCDATTTVNDLVTSVLKTQTLDIEVGKSTSSVTTGPASVTSEATAAGAVIKILPLPTVNGVVSTQPVVTIEIGSAKAKTVYNRDSGAATADADPAIVRIKVNTVLTDGLTLPEVTVTQNDDPTKTTVTTTPKPFPTEIVVTPTTLKELATALAANTDARSEAIISECEGGAAICILPDTPLESRIWLASESETVNADGSATAAANAVRVDLLVGTADRLPAGGATAAAILSDPAVHLALAHAEAAVGGRQAQTTPPNNGCVSNCGGGDTERQRTLDEPPLELPRTGGIPWMPLLGAAGLSLAVLFRRATLKATR